MKKITVYSTTTCPYCVMLTKWLSEHNIPFTEYKVDQNPFAAQAMVSISGQMGVPFTTIETGTSEDAVHILGFDLPRFQEVLGVV